ncbi:hypothetical protein [uncultured Exiguobacterium sp.]|nr:hypothetical protein [uncultured Exiguobacterium sp.]
MKKTFLILGCICLGILLASRLFQQSDEENRPSVWHDGDLVARQVGASMMNTVAVRQLAEQLPFSSELKEVEVEGESLRLAYDVTGKERRIWIGTDTGMLRVGQDFFNARLSKVLMHHTLVLFSTIPDLSDLEIHYTDPYSRADFKIDRKAFDAYTSNDIERATSSSKRFNRVVIDGYVLDASRRQTFFKRFASGLLIQTN